MTVYLSIIMIISTTTRRTTTIMSFASKMKTLQQALDDVINTATPSEEMQIRTFLSKNVDHIIEKSTTRDATAVATVETVIAEVMISGARRCLLAEAKPYEEIVWAAGMIGDMLVDLVVVGTEEEETEEEEAARRAAEAAAAAAVKKAAMGAATAVNAAVARMKEIENSWTRTIASMDDDEEEEAEVLASIVQMDAYARSEVTSMGYGVASEAIAMIMDTKVHPTNQTVMAVAEEVVAKVSNAMVSTLNTWESDEREMAADERARDPIGEEDEEELEKRAHVLDRKADEISFIRKDVIEAVKKAMEGWRNEIAS
jgi:hypothetical protein